TVASSKHSQSQIVARFERMNDRVGLRGGDPESIEDATPKAQHAFGGERHHLADAGFPQVVTLGEVWNRDDDRKPRIESAQVVDHTPWSVVRAVRRDDQSWAGARD